LLNLLSVGASFGALVLVFRKATVATFWARRTTGTVYPIVPILSFAIVFGLSMDYEVFLVARVLENGGAAYAKTAVIEGLAHTAGLITSAAAIYDCRVHRIHRARLSGRPNARLYARRGGVH